MKVKENYVNVIPMKEIRSTDDLLFPFLFTMIYVRRVILDTMRLESAGISFDMLISSPF